MKHLLLSAFLFLNIISIYSQSPQLVEDFNPGFDGAFGYVKSVRLGNTVILALTGQGTGEELGALKNGELTLLKDINEGPEGSAIDFFTVFNDRVYFSAFDPINKSCIWSTDGTSENTKIEFVIGDTFGQYPRHLIKSKSGYLYYTSNNAIYRTDGINNEKIFDDATLFSSYEFAMTNYTTYLNEIAFLVKDEDDFITLYAVQDNGTVEMLSKSPDSSSFPEFSGLTEVENGLLYVVDDPFTPIVNGTWTYNHNDQSLKKIQFNSESANRIKPYVNGKALVFVAESGYFISDGIPANTEFIYQANEAYFIQGQELSIGLYEDKLLFPRIEGTWGEDYIVYSDGTENGTVDVIDSKPSISDIYTYNHHAFVAVGTADGFKPELYYIDMRDGSVDNFYNFNESSSFPSIQFVAAVDERIYFVSNLDLFVGYELYYIELNTLDVEYNKLQSDFSIEVRDNTYIITTANNLLATATILTKDGKVVYQNDIMTNTILQLPELTSDIYLLSVQTEQGVKTIKFYK